MINKDVIHNLTWLFSLFDIKLLTFIAAGFTIYFGYQKVTKKVCVSYTLTMGGLYNTHLTNFVITNKRDNVIVISSILMKIGDKGIIEIINFPEPVVLKGYDAQLIDIPQYSAISGPNGPVSLDHNDRLSFSLVTGAGEIIACEVESPVTEETLKSRLSVVSIKFNDIVLTRNMGFIFTYSINETVTHVIFDKHGFIEGYTPFQYNMFPNMSEQFFGDFLLSQGYHTLYDNYALFKVQDNLETLQVLNKAGMLKKLKKT